MHPLLTVRKELNLNQQWWENLLFLRGQFRRAVKKTDTILNKLFMWRFFFFAFRSRMLCSCLTNKPTGIEVSTRSFLYLKCVSNLYADYCTLGVVRLDKCFLQCWQLNLCDVMIVNLSFRELKPYEVITVIYLPFWQLKLYDLIIVARYPGVWKLCDVITVNCYADCWNLWRDALNL
jgi:hypothetical protein